MTYCVLIFEPENLWPFFQCLDNLGSVCVSVWCEVLQSIVLSKFWGLLNFIGSISILASFSAVLLDYFFGSFAKRLPVFTVSSLLVWFLDYFTLFALIFIKYVLHMDPHAVCVWHITVVLESCHDFNDWLGLVSVLFPLVLRLVSVLGIDLAKYIPGLGREFVKIIIKKKIIN